MKETTTPLQTKKENSDFNFKAVDANFSFMALDVNALDASTAHHIEQVFVDSGWSHITGCRAK